MTDNESVTFRINSSTLSTLRKKAEDTKISLNTFVNQILSNYVEWEMTAAQAGFATVHKQALREVFDALDSDKIREIALRTAIGLEETIMLMYGKFDSDTLITLLKLRAKRSGFRVREYEENGQNKIVLQHDMGRKWSEFFQIQNQALINKAGSGVQIEVTDNSIVMLIRV